MMAVDIVGGVGWGLSLLAAASASLSAARRSDESNPWQSCR